MPFKPANKAQSKARLAIYGPSGSGKTFSALAIATGLAAGGRIALIDTEFGRANNYSDRFKFDASRMDTATVDDYTTAIAEARASGYPVLIIDSLTHGWHELLELVDRSKKGNFGGWADATPKQKAFIRAILSYPGHVVCTMRVKTEWAMETDAKGRMVPRRVGLAPEQGKGIEYEFDILLEMDPDHNATVIKDNLTGTLQDKRFTKPDATLGTQIREWLIANVPIDGAVTGPASSSSPPAGAQTSPLAAQASNPAGAGGGGVAKDKLLMELQMLVAFHKLENLVPQWCNHFKVAKLEEMPAATLEKLIAKTHEKYKEVNKAA